MRCHDPLSWDHKTDLLVIGLHAIAHTFRICGAQSSELPRRLLAAFLGFVESIQQDSDAEQAGIPGFLLERRSFLLSESVTYLPAVLGGQKVQYPVMRTGCDFAIVAAISNNAAWKKDPVGGISKARLPIASQRKEWR